MKDERRKSKKVENMLNMTNKSFYFLTNKEKSLEIGEFKALIKFLGVARLGYGFKTFLHVRDLRALGLGSFLTLFLKISES